MLVLWVDKDRGDPISVFQSTKKSWNVDAGTLDPQAHRLG
jgi:hypothetical protein